MESTTVDKIDAVIRELPFDKKIELWQLIMQYVNEHSVNTPVIKSVCEHEDIIRSMEDLMTAYQIWKVKQK